MHSGRPAGVAAMAGLFAFGVLASRRSMGTIGAALGLPVFAAILWCARSPEVRARFSAPDLESA